MIRRPPRSTRVRSSAASDVYKRQQQTETPPLTRRSQRPLAELLIRARAVYSFWACNSLRVAEQSQSTSSTHRIRLLGQPWRRFLRRAQPELLSPEPSTNTHGFSGYLRAEPTHQQPSTTGSPATRKGNRPKWLLQPPPQHSSTVRTHFWLLATIWVSQVALSLIHISEPTRPY